MIKLYRYLSGYVKIAVLNNRPERFINICTKEGIVIWAVARKGDSITLCLSIKDYFKLRSIRKNIAVRPRIKLLEKRGVIFKLRKYKKRPGILVGLIAFVIINFLLSSFIWDISVVGNKKISPDEIIEYVESEGLKIGSNKKSIDIEHIKQTLPQKIEDVAWVSVNIEGSTAKINISEAENSEKTDNKAADLIASYEGVIKEIKATHGDKVVQVGQAVLPGDLLVSGVVKIGDLNNFVRAEGQVLAETRRSYCFNIKKEQTYYLLSGKTDNKRYLKFFWWDIPLYLSGVKGNYSSSVSRNNLHLFGSSVPVSVVTRKFFFLEEIKNELDSDKAESLALEMLTDKIRNKAIISVDEYKITTKENGDSYTVRIDAVCTEDIAKLKEIEHS